MKYFINLLLLFFSLQLFSQDTSAPELVSFSISPQTVDITNGPGQITITIGVTDDISGVSNVFPHYNLPNGNSGNSSATMISGTDLDGVWEKVYTIPQYTQSGTGFISPLNISDNVSNQLSLNFQDLVDMGFDPYFEIIDDNPSDVNPPIVTSFSISPQVVDITDGPGQITVTIGVTDDLSGVKNVFPHYNLPNGNSGNSSASMISGTDLDGVWEKVYTIPQYTESGTGFISPLNISDKVSNQLSLNFQDLIDMGFDPYFEVTDDNPPDLTPPTLTSFSITPQIVDITNGPGQITVTIGATDDLSGISNIFPFYNFPSGISGNGGASMISGTDLDGVWEKVYTVPQFTQTGTGTISPLKINDNVGNQLELFYQDLIDLGYDPDFEIIDNSILPVVYAQPLRIENQNVLTWTISQQINNSHFEVEHSTDGRFFQSIGRIVGEGNTSLVKSYRYVHENQSFGMNYYRVNQVDHDGASSYSNVVSEEHGTSKFNVYPNPFENRLMVSSPHNDSAAIYNHLGQGVGAYKLNKGQTEIALSHLESGMYLMKFSDGSIKRIVKN